MTSWPSEREAILNMIDKFGDGPFACVMDSYDYKKALDEVVPSIAAEKARAGLEPCYNHTASFESIVYNAEL